MSTTSTELTNKTPPDATRAAIVGRMALLFGDFEFDPSNPQLPDMACWTRLSREEQKTLMDLLPADPEPLRISSEGDVHYEAVQSLRETLRRWFRAHDRAHYVGVDKAVYYHGETVFSPDIFVVFNTDPGPRMSWIVPREKRGLDVAFEVLHAGNRKKDLVRNVERFARLGIHEYFVFDVARSQLHGFALPAGESTYVRIAPVHGALRSPLLDLELALEGGRLRLYHGGASLPDHEDLLHRLQEAVDAATARATRHGDRAQAEAERAQAEAERAQAEAERAQAEAERADALARRVAELEALLTQTDDSTAR